MKILFTSFYFPPDFQGGAEISAYNVGKEFVKQGHEVHVLTRDAGVSYDDDFVIHDNLRLRELPKEMVSKATKKEVSRLIDQYDFDIVHTQSEYTAIGAVNACNNKDTKCVVSVRDYWLLDPLRMCYDFQPGNFACSKSLWGIIKRTEKKFRYSGGKKHLLSPFIALYLERFRRFEAKNVDKADALIANSHYMEKKHQELHSNIYTVYNPIDTTLFRFNEENKTDKTRLFFVGRLKPEKGIITLIKAIEEIKKEKENFVLDIVGTEEPPKWLKEEIKANNVEDYINFVGRIDFEKMPEAYNKSDIVVFPSEWQEPFGRISIEAMSCKKPVVATEVGGIPEVVEDQETGRVIEPGNAEALAEATVELIDDEQKRKEMGRKGRERVEEEFSTEVIAEKQLELYKRILD